MYAEIYAQAAALSTDVVGESQLVGYKSQFPSVTMINYNTSEPNARFWVLKLLHDNFGPGDKLMEASASSGSFMAQAFDTSRGKKLLVINKRNRPQSITLPGLEEDAGVTFVAPSAGDNKPESSRLTSATLVLEPFEVAVVDYK